MTNFDDPIATALRAARLLESADIRYGLYGGLAVAAWGVARETNDADLAVVSASAERVVALFVRDGVEARAAFERVAFGGLIISRVTLFGTGDDSGLNTVDLVQPASARYAEDVLQRVLRAALRDEEISLLTPEDVIIFKLLSTRDKDLEDAASILHVLQNEIRFTTIDAEVASLSREIPGHDVSEKWERCRALQSRLSDPH